MTLKIIVEVTNAFRRNYSETEPLRKAIVTNIKTAANSLARTFLKLNLLIPLIFNNKIYNFCKNLT